MADSAPAPLPVQGNLMRGKRGLIMGVANDRSLAWGIASACAAQGAELAFTFQGEALERRVRPLAEQVGSDLVFPCDVTDDASIDQAFAALARHWDGLDFLVHAIGFADKQYPARPLSGHAAGGLPAGAGYLLLLVHRGLPARGADDEAGRQPADTVLSRGRTLGAALQRDGRREGGAGGIRALSGGRPGRHRHPRATRSAPGRSRPWRPPASAISATSCAGTSSIRRCSAT